MQTFEASIDPQAVAVVVGASGGIGQSIAQQLLDQVAVLVVAGRDKGRLDQLVETLTAESTTTQITASPMDVEQPKTIEASFQAIYQQHKRLDILINAAGVLQENSLMFNQPEQLQHTFAVNTFGSFYSAQFASRLMMRQKQGVIINIGSVVAEQGAAGQTAYSASKAALNGLTCSLAKELAPYNIRVNSLAPGFIETELVAHYSAEQRAQLASKTAVGRLGKPEDVAALAAFLCSKGAAYITGQTLHVDGMMRI